MTEWKTLDDSIPDPGTIWDERRWVVYTVHDDESAWMAVTTLMGFYNLVNFNEQGDPLPVNWMLVTAPALGLQERT